MQDNGNEWRKFHVVPRLHPLRFLVFPHGRWGQGPGSVDPRFPAGLPFPVPEILEFVAFRDSGKIFQQFSQDFPGVFLENARADPGNSHSLLEFSDSNISKQGSNPTPWAGVCETKSRKGRSRHRNPFMHRVHSAQRGIQPMVSEGARPWGRGRSELLKAIFVVFAFLCPSSILRQNSAFKSGTLETRLTPQLLGQKTLTGRFSMASPKNSFGKRKSRKCYQEQGLERTIPARARTNMMSTPLRAFIGCFLAYLPVVKKFARFCLHDLMKHNKNLRNVA